jgi:hypothetical protein
MELRVLQGQVVRQEQVGHQVLVVLMEQVVHQEHQVQVV